jgi:hypothetical protein
MAWSPPALNAGIVWVSAPGDYASFNSNRTPDGTNGVSSSTDTECLVYFDFKSVWLRTVAQGPLNKAINFDVVTLHEQGLQFRKPNVIVRVKLISSSTATLHVPVA